MKTEHQKRVENFMRKAGQDVPANPTVPDAETRTLRAKLILEEALETVKAMGINVTTLNLINGVNVGVDLSSSLENLKFTATDDVDIIEVADGCADITVVTTGTLSAFGISDEELLKVVDEHNLAKFGPGGHRRGDGKWIKPSDLQPPNIEKVLEDQKVALKVFSNSIDYVVARNTDEAQDYLEKAALSGTLIEKTPWSLVSSDEVIDIEDVDKKEMISLTAKEWIKAMGEGYLTSKEFED